MPRFSPPLLPRCATWILLASASFTFAVSARAEPAASVAVPASTSDKVPASGPEAENAAPAEVVAAPSLAEAPSESDPPGYGAAIDAAIREHELGHFQEARELLRRAHALFPNARTLRGLGKVEYELRNYGDAVHYLEEALSSRVRPLDARLRADVEQVLGRARAYVGEVHVNVDPGTAAVIVDGVTVASGPNASFSLLVGEHVIEFRADGRLPERRAVRVKGGEQTNIQVVLSPHEDRSDATARAAVIASMPPMEAPRKDRKLSKNPWFWSAVGVVLAGTATAIGIASTRDRSPQGVRGGSSGVVLGDQP